MSDHTTEGRSGAVAADRMRREAEAAQRIGQRVRVNKFSNSYTVDVDKGALVLAQFKLSDLYDAREEAERFAGLIREALLKAAPGPP